MYKEMKKVVTNTKKYDISEHQIDQARDDVTEVSNSVLKKGLYKK